MLKRLAIIHISWSYHETEQLAFLIADKVKLAELAVESQLEV